MRSLTRFRQRRLIECYRPLSFPRIRIETLISICLPLSFHESWMPRITHLDQSSIRYFSQEPVLLQVPSYLSALYACVQAFRRHSVAYRVTLLFLSPSFLLFGKILYKLRRARRSVCCDENRSESI